MSTKFINRIKKEIKNTQIFEKEKFNSRKIAKIRGSTLGIKDLNNSNSFITQLEPHIKEVTIG